jgi:hypothetical protein
MQGTMRSRALWARLIVFGAVLILAFGISQAAAAPFAYVANFNSNTVSVVDTATNPPSVVRLWGSSFAGLQYLWWDYGCCQASHSTCGGTMVGL